MRFDSKQRKAVAWHIDRAILPILVIGIAGFGILFHLEISSYLNVSGWFIVPVCVVLLVLGLLKLASSLVEPYEITGNSPEEGSSIIGEDAKTEYEEGNKLSIEYFKGSWTANSIFLPICFTLVAVSYYKELLELAGNQLLPLAGASIFLYLYSWAYTNRYASYNRSIWKRLRDIEEKKKMDLHRRIKRDDLARSLRWRLRHVNTLLLVLLLVAWGIRLYLAPLVSLTA